MTFLKDFLFDMFWIALAVVLLTWVGLKKSKKSLDDEAADLPNPEENERVSEEKSS